MIVRKLRLQRGWSQEHLVQLSGLSVRTIQRIERGQSASLESLKSLAAVFDVDLNDLQQQEADITSNIAITLEEQKAIEYVRDIKGFYMNLISFAIVIPLLFLFNNWVSPVYIWAWWVVMGWGIGIAFHALTVFEVFNLLGADWEKRKIEQKLGRKL